MINGGNIMFCCKQQGIQYFYRTVLKIIIVSVLILSYYFSTYINVS